MSPSFDRLLGRVEQVAAFLDAVEAAAVREAEAIEMDDAEALERVLHAGIGFHLGA